MRVTWVNRMSVREEGASVDGRRLLYSVEEAAQLLGIGRTFMFQLVAAGHVDSLRLASVARFLVVP